MTKLAERLTSEQLEALDRVANALAERGRLETEQQEKEFLERCERAIGATVTNP